MAGYKGHLVGAAVCGTAYAAAMTSVPEHVLEQHVLSHAQLLAALYVVALLFGLWPDVDTNSKGQNVFFGIAFISDILLIITGRLEAAAYLGLIAMTPIVGKHRGWTHSKLAMLAVPLPLAVIPYLYNQNLYKLGLILYGAAVVGYFSHLLLDGLITRHFVIKG